MKRVLLKISGELLSTPDQLIAKTKLENLKNEIKKGVDQGVEIGIVIGGGNLWRGRDNEELGLFRAKSDIVGMLATIMNAVVVGEFLKEYGIPTKVFVSRSMPSIAEEFTEEKAEKTFQEGYVLLFAGGTGNPYFTTDSAAALRAIQTKCEVLLKATTVDGIFDDDPRKNPNAKKYEKVSFDEVIQKNLKVMDTSAFALARENNLSIRVFNGESLENIGKVLAGEKMGTLVVQKL